jgi:hypothetical protein
MNYHLNGYKERKTVYSHTAKCEHNIKFIKKLHFIEHPIFSTQLQLPLYTYTHSVTTDFRFADISS